MTKPFNVTLIQPRGYVHSLALKEAADYVDATIRQCGYASSRSSNRIANGVYNVIFCGHLLAAEVLPQIPADSIVFNSEQLDEVNDWHFATGVYRQILEKHYVWDYSAANLLHIHHSNKCQIPFL